MQAVDPLVKSDSRGTDNALAAAAKACEDPGLERLSRPPRRVEGQREGELLGGQAHGRDLELAGERGERVEDDRMQMQVVVPVGVGERETGLAEPFELGSDLLAYLARRQRRKLCRESGADGPRPEEAPLVDEVRDPGRGQGRAAVDQNEVNPHREPRVRPGEPDCFVGGLAGDHETRVREHAAPVRLDDGAIDAPGLPEIVAGDDEASQAAPSRFRRKRANSAPSRSRRFSMSMLDSISSVISAIFRGRK